MCITLSDADVFFREVLVCHGLHRYMFRVFIHWFSKTCLNFQLI